MTITKHTEHECDYEKVKMLETTKLEKTNLRTFYKRNPNSNPDSKQSKIPTWPKNNNTTVNKSKK